MRVGGVSDSFFYKEINSNLGGLSFGTTEDGRPGWKDGADAVHPFNELKMSSRFSLYSYAGTTTFYNCPSTIKVTSNNSVKLINTDTNEIITTGTDIEINDNKVQNISIEKYSGNYPLTTVNVDFL